MIFESTCVDIITQVESGEKRTEFKVTAIFRESREKEKPVQEMELF